MNCQIIKRFFSLKYRRNRKIVQAHKDFYRRINFGVLALDQQKLLRRIRRLINKKRPGFFTEEEIQFGRKEWRT